MSRDALSSRHWGCVQVQQQQHHHHMASPQLQTYAAAPFDQSHEYWQYVMSRVWSWLQAMPFVGCCVSLKSLRLGEALPAAPGGT